MRLRALLLVSCLAASRLVSAADAEVKLEGYAEWRNGPVLLVDGQRVEAAPGMKFKGQAPAKDFGTIPLGYEVKVKGTRRPDGVVVAKEVEAKPNGSAMFEREVLSATDELEASWVKAGKVFEPLANGSEEVIGRLHSTGPDVDRVRTIVGRVTPPHRDPAQFRVYVVDNAEWNAFACANGMIVVHSQLLADMNDDDLGIIMGHELVHVTHEHTRRQFKSAMWIQLVGLGVLAGSQAIDDKKARAIVDLAAVFSLMAWKNGYSREHEDQADRVGIRYAHEGGYDVRRGPDLWMRFAKKYGDQNRAVNFFFGDHSVSAARAKNIQREIALNYSAPAVRPAP
ncbi:MAG: M48 family metalloprotease [Acidobacteriota bacterium]